MATKKTRARPRLTKRIVDGLNDIYAVADLELGNGDSGAFDELSDSETDAVALAIKYLGELIDWHRAKQKRVR